MWNDFALHSTCTADAAKQRTREMAPVSVRRYIAPPGTHNLCCMWCRECPAQTETTNWLVDRTEVCTASRVPEFQASRVGSNLSDDRLELALRLHLLPIFVDLLTNGSKRCIFRQRCPPLCQAPM